MKAAAARVAVAVTAVLLVAFILILGATPRAKRAALGRLLELSERNDVCQLLDEIWVGRTGKDFECATHEVVTKDGYILELKHLVPKRNTSRYDATDNSRRRGAVMLVPGLSDSSSTFVLSGRRRSLAGTLIDAGIEVWLFDPRGRAPLRHVNLSSSEEAFWDFSFDEKVDEDLPAAIDRAIEISGVEALAGAIGHSQGALLIMMYLATMHKQPAKLQQAFLLAPPLSGWSPAYAVVKEGLLYPTLSSVLPIKDMALSMLLVRRIISRICVAVPMLCVRVLCMVGGCGKQSDLDSEHLSRILTFYPSASSLKNIEHLLHCERQGRVVRSFLRHNDTYANFSQIETPISFYFGSSDRLVDLRRFKNGLPQLKAKAVRRYRVFDYGHADFIWGKNARRNVYSDILKLLDWTVD